MAERTIKFFRTLCGVVFLSAGVFSSTVFAASSSFDIAMKSNPLLAAVFSPSSSIITKFVLFTLVSFSIISWVIIFSKFLILKRVRGETEGFKKIFRESRQLGDIYSSTGSLDFSPLNQIFRAAYVEVVRIKKNQTDAAKTTAPISTAFSMDLSVIDNVERAMSQAEINQRTFLEKNLSFLATTGSTAPFIGLFGTVWGIMASFHEIGKMGSASLNVVAPGISEALIATAAGLAAAIPAVMAYNFFISRVKVLISEMNYFSSELMSIIDRNLRR